MAIASSVIMLSSNRVGYFLTAPVGFYSTMESDYDV